MVDAAKIALIFLAANIALPLVVLISSWFNNRNTGRTAESPPKAARDRHLKAKDILEWEFEYARTTASEAMDQRHTMVNFYLLVTGFVIAGVATVLEKQPTIPALVGAVLLWLLCGIGWIYFLSVVRLRQAWHDSARTMNRIKYYYMEHADDIPPAELHKAFRWREKTLPKPGKFWNVFFYSAMLIALLDSVAFVAGGGLLDWGRTTSDAGWILWPLVLPGVGLFAFHVLLYAVFFWRNPFRKRRSNKCPTDADTWVYVQKEKVQYTFRNLFRVIEAELCYRRFDGQMSEPMTRVSFERGDAVGVLLYDAEQDAVVLVHQFRYPVYARLSEEDRQGEGARQAWILEIVAGISEGDQSAPEVARRELLEEAGYTVQGDLQFIATLYPSPGGSSERIHLYWGEVRAADQARAGGGLEDEGEDTEVVVLPFRAAMEMIGRGEIKDGKTIVALQHLALHKPRQKKTRATHARTHRRTL